MNDQEKLAKSQECRSRIRLAFDLYSGLSFGDKTTVLARAMQECPHYQSTPSTLFPLTLTCDYCGKEFPAPAGTIPEQIQALRDEEDAARRELHITLINIGERFQAIQNSCPHTYDERERCSQCGKPKEK